MAVDPVDRTIGRGKFILDRDDEDIREWYDQIMKGEGVLADIGTCAFSHVIAIGVENGLLADGPKPTAPAREIIDVVQLFRCRLQRRSSEETISFSQVGYMLRFPPDDLLCRRCVELPRYFDVLKLHRNKRAHRGEVTVASLCALAGSVLGVLEITADDWVDARRLNDAAEGALVWATEQAIRESGEDAHRLRGELHQREEQLKKLRMELQELKVEGSQSGAAASNGDPEIVKRVLTTAKAHISRKVNESKEDLERRLDQIGDAVASLRIEVLDAQEHGQPSDRDEDDENASALATSPHRPQITGVQARAKIIAAYRKMKDRGVDLSVNVFQPWIRDEALERAAKGKMDQIDDWWKLPSVQKKTPAEIEHMREQLEIPNVEDWMMDIYRRVERRSDAT